MSRRPKVQRYFPGEKPSWAKEEEEDVIDTTKFSDRSRPIVKKDTSRQKISMPVVLSVGKKESSKKDKNSRPRRKESTVDQNVKPILVEHPPSLDSTSDADLDAISRRRARLKARAMSSDEEVENAFAESEEQESESSSSEEESDSESGEEDFYGHIPNRAPVFVKKTARATVDEMRRIEEEELEKEELKKMKEIERKAESERIAKEAIEREQSLMEAEEESSEEVYDEVSEKEEFELWKLREIARIRRAHQEKVDFEKEQKKISRRRKLTDAQIEEDNAKLGIKQPEEKKQWNYLQKYYHSGVFYQDLPELHEKRLDFDAPVGADKHDKSVLPQIMQVKDFGKRGRTKWTHLVAEDTTRAHHHVDPKLKNLSTTEDVVDFTGYNKQFQY